MHGYSEAVKPDVKRRMSRRTAERDPEFQKELAFT